MRYLQITLVLGAVALFLTGCTGRENKSMVTDQNKPVKVQAVRFVPDSSQYSYVGVVEESQSVPLSFLIAGTVEKVSVDEGEHVKKGQLLASLNSTSFQNAYQVAEAKEKQAQDAYERLSSVYKNGSLPEVKMVEIETGLEQAKSLVRIAKKNLEDCVLYSPVSGLAGKRSIEPGMNVIPGVPVITLVKIDKVFIKVSVPENEIASIKVGQAASVRVAALKNEVFTGKIEHKGVIGNPLSHTYDIKIAVANINEKLNPGMVCNVLLTKSSTGNYAYVPQQVVQIDNNERKYVYIADQSSDRAVRKIIETGSLWGNGNIIVTNGLKEGDLVIVEGYQKIDENTSVKIIR
ncbi:MAG: efflux RND transporter periplasmic adaptor subunit [Bacteroidales bacterium]|nr:efflux RND transporter periplasmic adaptor subunit [Bacteroidales bacterium]